MKHNRQLCLMDSLELDALTKEAVEYIRANEPAEGYYVGFSGGKDSIVTLTLVKMAGVKFRAELKVSGLDHPSVIAMTKRHYPEVVLKRPRRNFWEVLKKKPPPTMWLRWCCAIIKESDNEPHLITGVRAEESYKRSRYERTDTDIHGRQMYKPIFHWKEWAVWEFIETHRLTYPDVYDKGWGRVGCIICPFNVGGGAANKHRRELSQRMYPKQWAHYKRTVQFWWETRCRDKRFPTFDEYWTDFWECDYRTIKDKEERNLLIEVDE